MPYVKLFKIFLQEKMLMPWVGQETVQI